MFHRRLYTLAIATLLVASFLPTAAATESDLDTANKLFAAKKYAQAILEYQKVLDANPDHWAANYYTAMSWMAQFHPQSLSPEDAEIKKQGLGSLEKLMTLPPPTPGDMGKVENYYLSLLVSAGDNEEAIAFLERKVALEPNDLDRLAQLAQIQAKTGNFEESLRSYEKLAELEPEQKTHWYTVGVLCWERSNKAGETLTVEERLAVIQKGIDALDKALAIDPEYTEAIAYLNMLFREKADVLRKMGRTAEAQEAFQESQRLREQAIELMQKKK